MYIKAYIIVEINATPVSVIHNNFSQKRLKIVKNYLFEVLERSVIFIIIKTLLCIFRLVFKSYYIIFSGIFRKGTVP